MTAMKAESGSDNNHTHTKYMDGVNLWEEQANKVDGSKYVTKSRLTTTADTVSEDTFNMTTNHGIWWPATVYKQKKGKSVPPHFNYTLEGEGGIVMDVTDGFPVGAVRFDTCKKRGLEVSTNLGDTDDELRAGQVFDAAVAVRRKVSDIRMTADDSGEGYKVAAARTPSRKDTSGSEPDFLQSVVGPGDLLVAPEAAGKSASKSAGSGSGGGGGGGSTEARVVGVLDTSRLKELYTPQERSVIVGEFEHAGHIFEDVVASDDAMTKSACPLDDRFKKLVGTFSVFKVDDNHMRMGSKPMTAMGVIFEKFVAGKARAMLAPRVGVLGWLRGVADETCGGVPDLKALVSPDVQAILTLEYLAKCSQMLALEAWPFCPGSDKTTPRTVPRQLACLIFDVQSCFATDAFSSADAAAKATWDELLAASSSIVRAWASVDKLSPKLKDLPSGPRILKVLNDTLVEMFLATTGGAMAAVDASATAAKQAAAEPQIDIAGQASKSGGKVSKTAIKDAPTGPQAKAVIAAHTELDSTWKQFEAVRTEISITSLVKLELEVVVERMAALTAKAFDDEAKAAVLTAVCNLAVVQATLGENKAADKAAAALGNAGLLKVTLAPYYFQLCSDTMST